MVLLTTFLFAAAASAKCYGGTTAHPLPPFDSNDGLLKKAFESIKTELDTAIAVSGFNSTSFSVGITSSKETLWSQHHTARERNTSRPDIAEVNGDALYRIASVTKTFTVLGILHEHDAGRLHLDDSIDKYIKELKEDQNGTLPWKDITLRSLASQLSGIPRECTNCYSEQDLLKTIKSQRPLFAPNMKSSYSNTAFNLLGLTLARLTGKTYEAYITDAIFKPLGMSKSTFSTPPDSAGVIPNIPQFWDLDLGIQKPTGGIYSSTNDLSKFLRYVLTHYNSISTGVNWLNIGSAAGGINSFYGMPWEILQTDRILKDSRRTVRFNTKSGGLPGYTSMIVVVPEYDLGITILVAGEEKFFYKVLDIVSTTIVRAAEAIAIRQLKERYAGSYSAFQGTDRQTRLTLKADERGLVITEFISNNTDVLRNGFRIPPTSDAWYAQVVPTLLYLDEEKQEGELWRVVISDERSEVQGGVWDDYCITDFDRPLYAAMPSNEFIFWDEKDGEFRKLEVSAWKKKLTRESKDSMFRDEPQVGLGF